jgi:hypothetical protein
MRKPMKARGTLLRYYCVTFDISPSYGRENDYAKAAVAIKRVVGAGNYFKIMWQCCIVRTDRTSVDLRDAIKNRLESGVDIFVVRLARGSAFKIRDSTDRETASRLIREIDSVFIR